MQEYKRWLKDHLKQATAHYNELSRLDDQEYAAGGGDSAYYEQAHQMFGYIAALEKCLKQADAAGTAEAGKGYIKASRRLGKTTKRATGPKSSS